MNEQRLRFGIGVFVLAALVALAALIYLFSGHERLFRQTNHYTVLLPEAPGLVVGSPVHRSGVRVGEVDKVELDDETGDVRVGIALDKKYLLRKNDQVTVTQSMLGEGTVEIVTQRPPVGVVVERTPIPPGEEVAGVPN